MPLLSINDADFWGRVPDEFSAIMKEGGEGGVKFSHFELGSRKDNAPAVTSLRIAPGYVLPRHGHDCYRFEIIVQGSLTVEGQVLEVGSVMISEPGILYGPAIAGPEGCTTFEIFSNHQASHTALLEDDTGEHVACDVWSQEGAQKMMQYARKQAATFGK